MTPLDISSRIGYIKPVINDDHAARQIFLASSTREKMPKEGGFLGRHKMQNSKFNSTILLRAALLGSSALALGISAPAMAQVEEIVVTAQKVEENVQDVPIAISVISGEALANSGTTSIENLNQLVPSLNFRKGTTNANSALVLRGVGTITFAIAIEPSVSTVVDGVVLSRPGQAFADLVEIERLEVLRGPQGTLFGKNASAGLINVVSKGGTDTLEGEISVSAFEGDEYRLRGTIAGPLAPNLTARLNGFFGTYDGNITNINAAANGNRKVNGYEHLGVRGSLDYDNGPTRVRLIADYYKADDDCCAEVTGISRGAVLDAELGIVPAQGEDQRFINQNLETSTKDRQWGLTLNADFDVFSDHTLSFIAGYRDWSNDEIREGDFLPRPLVGFNQLHDNGNVSTTQYSAELRIASPQDQALTYQFGGFYWNSENSQDFTRNVTRCTTSTLPVDPLTGGQPCNLSNTTDTIFGTATSRSDVDVENYALFGQATYNFNEWIALTGGLRWTHDSLSFVHQRAPAVSSVTGLPVTGLGGLQSLGAGGSLTSNPPGNGTNISANSTTTNNVSGKAVLTVKPSEDVLVYGSFTRGYKGPAFNVFFNHVAPNNAVPIDEETSDSFEIGVKSQFLDRRVQLNASAFTVTYDGYQANNFISLNGVTVSNLTNAGSVRSKGFEIDALFNPVGKLNFSASVAYADAKVVKFNPNPTTNAPSAQNGTKLPLAPEWSWNIGADYEASLSSNLALHLNAAYNHVSSQFSGLGETGPLEGHGIINASIGLSDADDTWRFTLVGRNLADESYVTLNTDAGVRLHIPRDADRYFGATLRVRM
jgi:iron complex outermembrane recepter protein